jgi:hypothetical protein
MDSDQLINIGLYGGFALIVIAAVAAVGMNLYSAFANPKVLIKAGIGVGALLIIFFISYSIAPNTFDGISREAFILAEIDVDAESTGEIYKLVGGAMTTTLVLFVLAVVGLIYSSVAKIIQ